MMSARSTVEAGHQTPGSAAGSKLRFTVEIDVGFIVEISVGIRV